MKKLIVSVTSVFLIFLSAAFLHAVEKASPGTSPEIRTESAGTQFFCGYCHVLTYPKVMKRAYDSWKKDEKHKEVACAQCHYPPQDVARIIPGHKGIPTVAPEKRTEQEFMQTELAVLSRLTTLLNMEESVVRTMPRIDDLSCATSGCHPTTGIGKEGEYWTKKIKFTEYERPDKTKAVVSFTHKEHFDKKKWVEGQEMHCTTCHTRHTPNKHFEVSKESCFLCHFNEAGKQVKLGENRAACSLCHEIPKEPFKKTDNPDEKPVTHKDYEERKVSCASCHLELVRGDGAIKPEKCLDCHENDKKITNEVKNMKLMHQEHVAKQTAQCFNCHEPIQHKRDKEFTYFAAGITECNACHAEPHKYQGLLIAGEGGKGVDKAYPIKHHDMNTNCIACHIKDSYDVKGRKIKAAEEKTCAACHTEKEKDLAVQWKKEVANSLEAAREKEKELIEAIKQAKGKAPEEAIKKAEGLLKAGQENLRIVDAGGGVHNKKYAELLLEIAEFDYFEAAIAELEPKK